MARKVARAIVLIAACALPSTASAQSTLLAVTGFPVTFAAPTAAELTAGVISSATPVTFTVDARTGTSRTTTVSIRCAAPCPAAGSKPMATLQWRRADQGTWYPLSTTDAVVETRQQIRRGLNDPWSNSVYFQFTLDWLSDPAGPANNYNIIMTLTVTVP